MSAVAELRAECNRLIHKINSGQGDKTPGFADINGLLKKCDVVFAEQDLQPVYEQMAQMGRMWLELLIARQEIDPDATAITFTANMDDGSKREVAKVTLADALKKFDDAGIAVEHLMEGLV